MVRFSVCIDANATGKSPENSIDSVVSQDFKNIELLVFGGKSSSFPSHHLEKCADEGIMLKVVSPKKQNSLHVSRKAVVDECEGDYVLFLDSGACLQTGFLNQLDRILAFNDVDLLRLVTDSEEEADSAHSWNFKRHIFKAKPLKQAFKLTKDVEINFSQDVYEMLAVMAVVKNEATNDRLGGLISECVELKQSNDAWSCDEFLKVACDYETCIRETQCLVEELECSFLFAKAQEAKCYLLDSLFNFWHERVADENKLNAADKCMNYFEKSDVATQLARCARDEAYCALVSDKTIKDCAQAEEWLELGESLVIDERNKSGWFDYSLPARRHLDDLRCRLEINRLNEQKTVRIFVSCHKEADFFESEILQPVQVGASRTGYHFPWTLQDDVGENISELNSMYCELTAQYWAWKNVDCEYYGFCHYRRYFNFSGTEYDENPFGEIEDNVISEDTQEKYGLTDENILKQVKGCDIITTKFQNLDSFPGEYKNPIEHWHEAHYLYDEDLNLMVDILNDLYPGYSEACKEYLNGESSCFCNMFVMKKNIFNEYCEWLFKLLEEFCERWDKKNYSKEALRTPGHLAERLLNIFILKHELQGMNFKHKQVQCVHFKKVDICRFPLCNFDESQRCKVTIPIVFAAGDNYVPIMTTAIYSLIKNANKEYRYDIVVLHKDISPYNQKVMHEFFAFYKNMSLRFFDVEALVANYGLNTSNTHVGAETYYRFLIQEVLPEYDKVIYLDSDLICEGDIAELYGVELNGDLIAAVSDIDFLGNLNYKDGDRIAYCKRVLQMNNPYAYFQAGVLLLNTKELRTKRTLESWLDLTENNNLIYDDQDILNMECEGRVIHLPQKWNVLHDCEGRVEKVFTFAPSGTFNEYVLSRTNPLIIHYAGPQKPWIYVNVDLEEAFWRYAKKTPFYQKLLDMRAKEQVDYKGWLISGEIDYKIKTQLKKHFEHHFNMCHPFSRFVSKIRGDNKSVTP